MIAARPASTGNGANVDAAFRKNFSLRLLSRTSFLPSETPLQNGHALAESDAIAKAATAEIKRPRRTVITEEFPFRRRRCPAIAEVRMRPRLILASLLV